MRSKTVLLLAIIFGLIGITYSTRIGGDQNGLITNSLALLPPFLASIYAFHAYGTYKQSSPHGRALLLIAVALLFWAIGEAAFFMFRFVVDINPYPSVADIAFLAGYPLMLAGLVTEIRTNKSTFKDSNPFVQFLITLVMLMLSIAVIFFGIVLAFDSKEPLLNNLVAMGYGVGDLILIAPTLYVLKMAVDYRGGKLFMSWGLILIALLMKLYADVFFAVYHVAYTANEWPYNMIDLVWAVSYMLMAYSFYSTASHVREVRSKLK